MSKFILALVLVVVVAVGVSAAPDACKCGTKSEQIANCSTSIHGCGCLRHWIHWQYNAQASADGVSGATAEWFESSTGAAEHALVNLFNALDKPTNCNCGGQTVSIGKCDIDVRACFFFNSTGDMTSKKATFRAFATDVSGGTPGKMVSACCFTNATNAGIVMVESLLKAVPTCLSASPEQAIPRVSGYEFGALQYWADDLMKRVSF